MTGSQFNWLLILLVSQIHSDSEGKQSSAVLGFLHVDWDWNASNVVGFTDLSAYSDIRNYHYYCPY